MAVVGKISRLGTLRYTPSGVPVSDFTVAVPQRQFDKESVGYFEVQIFGQLAEDQHPTFRVGKRLEIEGTLWSRTYQHRKGIKISETKIIVHSIGGNGET